MDAVRALMTDFDKTFGGVVPVFRQGQHDGEQPFELERQPALRR